MSTKISISPTLQHVVDATLSPAGFTYLSADAVKAILSVHPNAITVDITTRDAHGNVAARATAEGISEAFGGGHEAHVEPSAKTRFHIEDGHALPPPRRGIQAEPRYPFALMNAGQSFMVPATPERPNPAKALASTVSSANKRMAKIGKKFVIRPVDGGARIWRVE